MFGAIFVWVMERKLVVLQKKITLHGFVYVIEYVRIDG